MPKRNYFFQVGWGDGYECVDCYTCSKCKKTFVADAHHADLCKDTVKFCPACGVSLTFFDKRNPREANYWQRAKRYATYPCSGYLKIEKLKDTATYQKLSSFGFFTEPVIPQPEPKLEWTLFYQHEIRKGLFPYSDKYGHFFKHINNAKKDGGVFRIVLTDASGNIVRKVWNGLSFKRTKSHAN